MEIQDQLSKYKQILSILDKIYMHSLFCRNIIDCGLVNIHKYLKQKKKLIILIFKIVVFVLQQYTTSDNESYIKFGATTILKMYFISNLGMTKLCFILRSCHNVLVSNRQEFKIKEFCVQHPNVSQKSITKIQMLFSKSNLTSFSV